MNATKKINVNCSSLVGLKAELLRKQTEVKEAKAHIETTQTTRLKRKLKQVKNDNKNASKELTDVEEINNHKKSKIVLEAKSRLYTKLKKLKNNNDNYLVDFTNKSDESEEEDNYDDRFVDPEDSWVEYEDCFGRTRKCLAKDLPLMRQKDDLLKQEIMKKNMQQGNESNKIEEVQPMKESEIDVMRRKWEEQTQKLADKFDIHYQDILFDEARAHGVGYYAFSQDGEERAKQQENLNNLRKETEQKQKRIKELKDLKDKMERNRLKAARIRQRIRAGLPIEPEDQEDSINTADASNDINNTYNVSSIKESEISKDDTCKKNEKTKEEQIKALEDILQNQKIWREMSQEEWVYKCREERIPEFAPVYDKSRTEEIKQPDDIIVSDRVCNQIDPLTIANRLSIDQNTSLNNSINSTNTSKQFSLNINNQQNGSSTEQNILKCNNDFKNQSSQSINNALNKTINEDKIAAGLRYLREKYEQSQNR